MFGIHTNDNTPLIIDQPEDNLDNQYIYKNLVSSLRQIKNNRQVIIVTHSSTIVTNAVAEQVIVLNSDNQKSWVEQRGYQGNPKITKLVLQYLEGGQESFIHKMNTYNTILKIGIAN
jgi:predicted ATP-dependent endonuclease of OLD family